MNQYFNLKIGDHLKNALKKKFYNERVFAEIAPRYDFITRALSFGCDASWKRELIDLLPPKVMPTCLDIACGTGDIAFLLAEKYLDGKITGIDITESMLKLARTRNSYSCILFKNGDMGQLNFPDSSVDIITGGYALRNAPDLKVTLDEIARVLKPGGVAAFLDFSKPSNIVMQRLEYWLLKVWTGFWGILFHRNHEVYSYIAESLSAFPNREILRNFFQERGFSILSSKLHFGGITETIIVRKNDV